LNKSCGDPKHAYVVEGCFDAIALHAFGFPAVALMGNSISPEQVELLWRAGVRYVTVLLDGNDEGRAAAPAVHQALGERVGEPDGWLAEQVVQ
jgi:DNA primase